MAGQGGQLEDEDSLGVRRAGQLYDRAAVYYLCRTVGKVEGISWSEKGK